MTTWTKNTSFAPLTTFDISSYHHYISATCICMCREVCSCPGLITFSSWGSAERSNQYQSSLAKFGQSFFAKKNTILCGLKDLRLHVRLWDIPVLAYLLDSRSTRRRGKKEMVRQRGKKKNKTTQVPDWPKLSGVGGRQTPSCFAGGGKRGASFHRLFAKK